jgi:DNA-binding transcriptional LysR family regulator
MKKENLNDLVSFITIAREKSFTKAARILRVSQSALSHTMHGLEDNLGVRLLQRTTRSVSPTEAGEKLLNSIAPLIENIEHEIASLSEFRDKPKGTIRISAGAHAADMALIPKILDFVKEYPDINVEVSIEAIFTDIVSKGFDAGVRLGEYLEKDMVAVPISPMMRLVVVATPEYFTKRPKPTHPSDLINHNCINFRLPTYGELYQWEFERGGHEIKVKTNGQLTFNSVNHLRKAVLQGLGIAFVMEDTITEELKNGTLIQVLDEWCAPFDGYYLYYPMRRQLSPAFKLLVETLRTDR